MPRVTPKTHRLRQQAERRTTHSASESEGFKRRYPRQQRPCLCCGARVFSTGPHHRLCKTCRHDGELVPV